MRSKVIFAIRFLWSKCSDSKGQATVEAAFVLPVLLLLMFILLQPSLLLFDQIVMRSCAAELCRLAATNHELSLEACVDYGLDRLAIIPNQSLFHVCDDTCSWKITITPNESTNDVSVQIANKVKPLPLFAIPLRALRITDDSGYFSFLVEESAAMKQGWARESGVDETMIGKWCE